MSNTTRILVTGATGKVGRAFIKRVLADPKFDSVVIRALCHHRELEAHDRLEIVRGSIEHLEIVEAALADVSHVVHLATCKETPDQIMDVAVKGLFWLLEVCRASRTFRQFMLIGGDAGVGHFFYPHPIPVTETQRHSAYPGCYALSKVLEEVMLEQYYLQYDLNGCCLRAPWIMEKDDFKYQLSFGADVFGGPRWRDLVDAEQAAEYVRTQTIPVMLDAEGQPVKRNFVHVEILSARCCWHSITRAPGTRRSTSAWMSRWITPKWAGIWPRVAGCRRSASRRPITRPGWTMQKRSCSWAGDRSMI